MYKVINFFTDLHDNDHPYNVGDTFPREGVEVTEERLAELAGSSNRQGKPLIEPVKTENSIEEKQESEDKKAEPVKKTKRGTKASEK